MEQHSFGYWLRLKRKALDLTREELAERVGYSAATIRKIEDEERHPSTQIVERLAEIFNIPPNERTDFLNFARGDWQSAPSENKAAHPWHSSSKMPPSNLPATLTSLVGREQEIVLVRGYLLNTDIRLVTLIGPPGIGKTRLSIEAARASLIDFPDGVFFVALAPLDDSTLIATTVAQSLGYVGAMNISIIDQLKEGIGDKHMLIVLDNCEHLIEDIASLASNLLSACSRLKILATSRESLRISGEWLYPVPAFDVPAESSAIDMNMASSFPALTLFAERARAVRSDFSLNDDNIKTVAAICARLDGLPLVIELIAARIRLMSPQALLERLNDQFILTADGMRAAAERQKTLYKAIDWSYKLLPPEEQKLFAYLSVFSGGFTLEAVETMFSRKITEKSLPTLIALLLDKSLLKFAPDLKASDETRYTMLVTIQEYARERLQQMGEETEIRNLHLAYFLDLAEKANKEIRGSRQLELLDRMELEHGNLRLAFEWTQQSDHRAESGLQLVNALNDFWITHGYIGEGIERSSAALNHARAFERTSLYSEVLCSTAFLAAAQGNIPVARSFAEKSLAISRELDERLNASYALQVLGLIAFDTKEYALAENLLVEALHNRRDFPNIPTTNLLIQLGWAAFGLGDYALARKRLNEALTLALNEDIRGSRAQLLGHLAEIDLREGKYDSASKLITESLAIGKDTGDKRQIGISFGLEALSAIFQHKWDSAFSWLKESIAVRKEIGDMGGLTWCLEKLGQVAIGKENPEKAARIFSAAESSRAALGSAMEPFDQSECERSIASLRNQLGEEKFNMAWIQGRAMTMEQAIAYALEDNS